MNKDMEEKNKKYQPCADSSKSNKSFEDVDSESLSEEDKEMIRDTASEIAEQYGEVLQRLAKE